jgi:ferredoxin
MIAPRNDRAAENGAAFDLLRVPVVGRFLRWRHARTAMQLPLLLLAVVMIWDGLTGSPLAPKNAATVLTWVHYRGLVVLALLIAGNLFCMACPFMLPRNLARRLVRPMHWWPRRLRNKWLAIILFVLIIFVYELFDLWATPWWTAWLIVAYFAVALIVDSLFKGAPFCKYVCPIGQFNFTSSLVSPLEIRIRDSQTCADCRTKDCIKGRDDLRGCELWLFQERKVGNMDCTFCLDCIHACPYDNVGILSRLPASELLIDPVRSGIGRFSRRPDLALLSIVFTFGALVNAFGMVSPVYALETWLANVLGVGSEAPVLGLIYVFGLIVEPLVLLGLAAWFARRWTKRPVSLLSLITRYAFALVPIGFGFWLAHYTFHFLTGFWTFVPVFQQLLIDLGIAALGTPRWGQAALLPVQWIFPLQVGLMGLGWLGSMLVAHHLAGVDAPHAPWRAFLPWATVLTLIFVAAIWLMSQPMEMRGVMLGG